LTFRSAAMFQSGTYLPTSFQNSITNSCSCFETCPFFALFRRALVPWKMLLSVKSFIERLEMVVLPVSVRPLKHGTAVIRLRESCDNGSRRSYKIPRDLVGRTACLLRSANICWQRLSPPSRKKTTEI